MTDYQNDADIDAGLSALDATGADDIGAETAATSRRLAGKVRKPVDKAVGAVEGVVARTLGEPAARKVRDQADAALGQADAALARAEDAYEAARFRVDRELAEQPYRTLALAAGLGVVIGLLMARRERTIIYRPVH